MESCEKLRNLLKSFTGKVLAESDINGALDILDYIQKSIVLEDRTVRFVDVDAIDKHWTKVGSGHFGYVYSSRYGGSKVAIKIFKEESASKMREGKILGSLSHENIIAFRGIGYISEEKTKDLGIPEIDSPESEDIESENHGVTRMFLVMEYINQNLFKYVKDMRVHERMGLSFDTVWFIGQQITSALSYLHTLKITHRDLKPDNILLEIGPRRIVVKLADFGLASDLNQINTNPPRGSVKGSSASSVNSSTNVANVRWGAPEVFKSAGSSSREWTLSDYKAVDVYCLGNVLTFTLTGEVPYGKISTSEIGDRIGYSGFEDETIFVPALPKSLLGPLKEVTQKCMNKNANERPNASDLLKDYFGLDKNPYLQFDPETEAEFFSCGFMDRTDIFVADSCTNIEASQIGFYESGDIPSGYDHIDLRCPIEVGETPYREIPEWIGEATYYDVLEEFLEKVKEGKIDNNPTVALKRLVFSRPGEDERQKIAFEFKESEYVHHRTMRKIWTELTGEERNNVVKAKSDVNSAFSNTFGLHVAVLTNEGPDAPQKFLFPRRASTAGMSSPGKYTCGAVESASKPDYKFENDGKKYVDLINTAARGLKEEIGLELTGSDLEAICLTTVYLKFDTHEWGLCGFVNLKDERVSKEHRLSADSLKDIFSSGPKDKFEHQTLTFIDFDLKTMVDFVFNNHEHFASSAKLVVVKVLQAFYGWKDVQHEFETVRFGSK